MKTGRISCVLTALALAACSLTGCADNEGSISTGSTSTGTVSTDGSTSMEKVIGFLSEAYMDKNSGVKVTYNPTGSGSGIQAVQEGRCDIGLSSRALKSEEAENLKAEVVAVDGIALVVNPKNTVSDLSLEEIAAIYTGKIKNWNEVGGSDSPVVCIGREAASGTRDGFESITCTADKCVYTQELTSTGDVIQTVASNPNAVGYASLASVSDSVSVVNVEGVTPSEKTILDGSYKIQRDFLLVTKKDSELTGTAKDFYNFCMSSEADEFIKKAGAVPVEK